MPVRWASLLRNARNQSPPGAETRRAGAVGDKVLGQGRAPLSGSHLRCRWAFERHAFWPCGISKAGEGSLGRPSTTLLGRFRADVCHEAPEPLLQSLHPLLRGAPQIRLLCLPSGARGGAAAGLSLGRESRMEPSLPAYPGPCASSGTESGGSASWTLEVAVQRLAGARTGS